MQHLILLYHSVCGYVTQWDLKVYKNRDREACVVCNDSGVKGGYMGVLMCQMLSV